MFKQRTYTTQRSLLLHISSARQSSVAGAGNTLKAIAAGLGLAGTLAVGALCMPTFAVAETPAAETANATSSTAQTTAPADTEAIYRLYNSWSGEHLYNVRQTNARILSKSVGVTKVLAGMRLLRETLSIVCTIPTKNSISTLQIKKSAII